MLKELVEHEIITAEVTHGRGDYRSVSRLLLDLADQLDGTIPIRKLNDLQKHKEAKQKGTKGEG